MPKRSSKTLADVNKLAKSIVDKATAGDATKQQAKDQDSQKNEAAVTLGRLGGLKGGPARARKLSAKKKSQIAKKAAEARWGKSNE